MQGHLASRLVRKLCCAGAVFLEKSEVLEFRNEVTVFRRDIDSHRGLLGTLPVKLPVEYLSLESPVIRGYIAPAYPEESPVLHEWAQATFSPKEGQDAVQLVHDMSRWIYKNIVYRRREDRGVQTPAETLRLKSGHVATWPRFC